LPKIQRPAHCHSCFTQGKQALRVYHPYSCSTLDKPTCTPWHHARTGTRTHHAKQAEQDCARRSLRSSAEMRARLASRNTVWGLVFQEYHRSKGRAWACAYLLISDAQPHAAVTCAGQAGALYYHSSLHSSSYKCGSALAGGALDNRWILSLSSPRKGLPSRYLDKAKGVSRHG
jgi:hypothetical protein